MGDFLRRLKHRIWYFLCLPKIVLCSIMKLSFDHVSRRSSSRNAFTEIFFELFAIQRFRKSAKVSFASARVQKAHSKNRREARTLKYELRQLDQEKRYNYTEFIQIPYNYLDIWENFVQSLLIKNRVTANNRWDKTDGSYYQTAKIPHWLAKWRRERFFGSEGFYKRRRADRFQKKESSCS